MSNFEWWMLIGMGGIVFFLAVIADELRKGNRHQSNIADRLLDIYLQRRGR